MSIIDLRDILVTINSTGEGFVSLTEDVSIVINNGTIPIVPDTITVVGNTITITILP